MKGEPGTCPFCESNEVPEEVEVARKRAGTRTFYCTVCSHTWTIREHEDEPDRYWAQPRTPRG